MYCIISLSLSIQHIGIHTDSDYFGSSLLYSRTFLHSYTMFMALQNTTAQMGATTLCPGTHMCANPDLENVCLQNGAFEVSSNGKTGSEGVLQQGDAMMFNQNIWHRGPKNHLKENRVMFIVTFVSRRDRHKGDVRIQGMGTYYYQRWTMWSHTFQDLAATGISTMTLPWAALKGLGLFKFPRQTWGISWIEHFARQLANRMDFYADYELPEFTQFLQQQQQQHLPVQVQWLLHDSISSREWETFLPELLQTVQSLFHQLHWVVLGVYVGVHLVAGLLARRLRGCRATSSVASSRFAVFSKWLLALLVGHSLVACIGYAVWEACLSSDLATFIQQGGYRQTPFGNHTPVLLQDTTFPTRQDVLVGSRFDAPFLASYNDVLQYHPGNQRLNQIMKQFQHWDQYLAVEATLNQFYRPVHGITSRILLQDYTAGFWTLHRNPREHVRRTMMSIQKPILGHLNIHLDQVLAESRFGIHRDTIMARKFTQMFALHWSNQLFGNPTTTARFPRRTRISTTLKAPSSSISYSRHPPSTFPFFPLRTYKTILGFFHPHQIEVGDKILANYENSGNYYEATIVDIFDAQICRVEYTNGEETEIMAKTGLRKFRSMLQGDQVVVDMDGDLFHGTLSKIHPLGTADILYQDGEQDQFVQQAQFQFLELLEGDQEELELSTAVLSPKPKSRHRPSNKNVFQVGQRVQADFRRQGEYFEGVIARVKQDGTYVVQYIDGDVEDRVLPQYIIGDV